MKNRLALAAFAVVAAALPVASATHADASPQAAARPVRDLPNWAVRPCATEDSVNCRWTATGPRAQGNGTGHTYLVREFPGSNHMVCVMYVQPRYAAKHDYCEATR